MAPAAATGGARIFCCMRNLVLPLPAISTVSYIFGAALLALSVLSIMTGRELDARTFQHHWGPPPTWLIDRRSMLNFPSVITETQMITVLPWKVVTNVLTFLTKPELLHQSRDSTSSLRLFLGALELENSIATWVIQTQFLWFACDFLLDYIFVASWCSMHCDQFLLGVECGPEGRHYSTWDQRCDGWYCCTWESGWYCSWRNICYWPTKEPSNSAAESSSKSFILCNILSFLVIVEGSH